MNFAIAAPATTAETAGATEHRKLVDAAQQFEGMLLQEMLKPIKENGFSQGDGDGDSEDGDGGGGFAGTLSSYGTEAMATAIAKGGGLGIAKQVVAQVEGERASRVADTRETKSPGMPK